MKTSTKTLLTAASLMLGMTVASAQLLWNPAGGTPTDPAAGGNGTWNGTDTVWWDGTTNVAEPNDDNSYKLQGQGDVTVSGAPRINGLTIDNMTGNYTFTGDALFFNNISGGGTQPVSITTAASRTVDFQSGFELRQNSSRTVTHNGGGNVIVNGLGVSFGNNNGYTFNGDSTISLTGSVDFRHNAITYSGSSVFTTSSNITGANGFRLNSGTAVFSGTNQEFSTFRWQGGADVRFDPLSSNTLDVTGAFDKHDTGTWAFDFDGFNAVTTGTYNLISFGSTTFSVSDFTASNITFDSGLSGQFNFDEDTLQYIVIPEPSTLVLLGLAGLAVMLFRRRK